MDRWRKEDKFEIRNEDVITRDRQHGSPDHASATQREREVESERGGYGLKQSGERLYRACTHTISRMLRTTASNSSKAVASKKFKVQQKYTHYLVDMVEIGQLFYLYQDGTNTHAYVLSVSCNDVAENENFRYTVHHHL